MSEKNLLFFYYNFDSATLFSFGERQLWGSLNTPKFLMTLMTLTFMTGFMNICTHIHQGELACGE